MERVNKINYYLDIAGVVATRSTCLRRKYGAIIVKNDNVIATGYNGAPRGRANCNDLRSCIREKLEIPRGERYELCRSIHSEANAIISASRESMIGATLYMTCYDARTDEIVLGQNCVMCRRMIINAGIEKVVIRDVNDTYRIIGVNEWLENDESLDGTLGN